MHPVHNASHRAYHLFVLCLLAGVTATLCGCLSQLTATTPDSLRTAAKPPSIPVTRYGRYTLVELVPMAAQRDLLLQVIDVSVPNIPQATVGDGLRHVLQSSGFQLCEEFQSEEFSALPLPATHYHLGPLKLRDALSTLVGPAWNLHVDEGTRKVCFTRSTPSTSTISEINSHAIPPRERRP